MAWMAEITAEQSVELRGLQWTDGNYYNPIEIDGAWYISEVEVIESITASRAEAQERWHMRPACCQSRLAVEPLKPVGDIRFECDLDATLGERRVLNGGTSAVLSAVGSADHKHIRA